MFVHIVYIQEALAIIDVFRVFVFWFFNKVRQFEDEETRVTDIKTQFLGPGVAAASERAAILETLIKLTYLWFSNDLEASDWQA